MELKKSKDADLERKKFSWLALGGCSVLSLLLVSFVITSYDIKEREENRKIKVGDELVEETIAPVNPTTTTTTTATATNYCRSRDSRR